MGNTKNCFQAQLTMPEYFLSTFNISKSGKCLSAIILLLGVGLLLSTRAYSVEKKIDYVNLGATLLKDGYNQRAGKVLEKVQIDRANFDFSRYYTLKGILYQRLGYPDLSNIFFAEAIKKGNAKDPKVTKKQSSIYLYMARNYWQLKNYPKVIESIDNSGEQGRQNRQMYVIKAESWKQLGDYRNAWNVLDEGIKRYPEFSRFYSQKFYYLLGLGFYQRAIYYADKFLFVQKYSAKDYLAIAIALRETGQYHQAAILLQQALLRPGQQQRKKLLELLGQIYIDQEHYLAAALVFDWASISYPEFSEKAAILSLKAKQAVRSLQLNRRIFDQKAKFRQRMGIELYLQDYETLVTQVPALKRYGLLKDDKVRYAIGYAYFRNGEYDKARHYLQQINNNSLFRKASQIFQQIEKCENEPLECD